MRLDRFITLNLIRPFRRSHLRMGRGDAGRIPEEAPGTSQSLQFTHLPVLMYHSISDDPEQAVNPYYRVCVSPARFREQMQWLRDNGYHGMTLSAALTFKPATGNQKSERIKPFAITFDDGFRDFDTAAWPVLREFGFTATMYLPTAFIGDTRRLFNPAILNLQPSPRRECLTWSEVRELHQAGVEFGSHTAHHPKLVEITWPALQSEIRDSKAEIEDRLGVACPAFAYPYAFPEANRGFVDRFKEVLSNAGYKSNVTTHIGRVRPGDDPLVLKRLPVNQGDDQSFFAAKFHGAYDWLGVFQSWSKTLRRGLHWFPRESNHANAENRTLAVPDGRH